MIAALREDIYPFLVLNTCKFLCANSSPLLGEFLLLYQGPGVLVGVDPVTERTPQMHQVLIPGKKIRVGRFPPSVPPCDSATTMNGGENIFHHQCLQKD